MRVREAVRFIRKYGNMVEVARLEVLLNDLSPPSEVIELLEGRQNPDGGWPAFWSAGRSSLDATCFHLAQW